MEATIFSIFQWTKNATGNIKSELKYSYFFIIQDVYNLVEHSQHQNPYKL